MEPPYPTSIPPPSPPQFTVPATFSFSFEPNNHIFPALNSFPNPTLPPPPPPAPVAASLPPPTHPPYAEMIYTAIGALKEKDGSSKRAIAKYIEQVYKDHLPPTHDSLLTHHLKLLKSNGLLVMVKKSYQLPRSIPPQPFPPPSLPLQTPTGTGRGRGRPPKPKPQQQQNAEPVWVALGLSDEPAPAPLPLPDAADTGTEVKKRGRGRPPKLMAIQGVGPALSPRRGRPPKRLGRTPKPKSLSAISNGLKRRPGRPPKIQLNPTVIPFSAPVPAAAPATLVDEVPPTVVPSDSVLPIGSPRPRGRPRKNLAAVPGAPPPAVGAAAPPRGGRGRGRGRGQGRLAMVGKPKSPSGRPVGRPKGSTATAAQKAANDDLRRKLEYFQSKVKESVGVLKPYFNHESPVSAIAAIQELEILATLDLDAPLRDETQQLQEFPQQLPLQQQPPLPQELPLPHIYQQQYPQIPLQAQLQQLFQQHTSAPS